MKHRNYGGMGIFTVALALMAAGGPVREAERAPENTDGERPFRGDRRPGILAAPTDEPTGENAALFRRLGAMSPLEMLETVSEPVSSRE